MPSSSTPVQAPGGFVPEHAIAFGTDGGFSTAVDTAHPLPTFNTVVAALSAPLVGTIAASGGVGPFAPQLGRPVWLTLSGTWAGTVQVLRSIDGGVTRLPLTIAGQAWGSYAANCSEPVTEETVAGATYYLDVGLSSGTLAYRVEQ